MHNAPTVVYPVGRCAFYAGLLVALGLGSAAVGVVFLLGLDGLPAPWRSVGPLMGMLLWMAWAGVALMGWLRSPQGVLKWDSRAMKGEGRVGVWLWGTSSGDESTALSQVECVLDLQHTVLLRLRFAGAGWRWIWLERRSNTARWSDLRRALVSSRS